MIDVIVIGGGPAGLAAAVSARDNGAEKVTEHNAAHGVGQRGGGAGEHKGGSHRYSR